MADASYDVVMVGGGNKGLIAAMYLTKYGGLKVGIFEERHEMGGGWSSEEGPAPGFLANICAHNLGNPMLHYSPIYEDFPEWIEYGIKPLIPLLSIAYCFSDGRWLGIYSEEHDPTQEKTATSIARFSQKDAETWLWLHDKLNKYVKPAIMEFCFTPAQPIGTPDALDRLIANPESGIDPTWRVKTVRSMIGDLFDNIDVQTAFVRFLAGVGNFPDTYGGAFGAIPALTILLNIGTVPGGTHTLAHACQRIVVENGGRYFTRHPVDKIIVENGVAKGVRLADGSVVEAKKAVLSGVDPYQLCVELVGEEHLGPKLIRKIKNLEATRGLTWYTWALHERPKYTAEAYNPDLPSSGWIAFGEAGEQGMKDLIDEYYRFKMGLWPEPHRMALRVGDHSSYCPGYAPPGKCSCLSEVFVPSVQFFTEKEWKEKEQSHAQEVMNMWSRYAPNMTWDNVIGYLPITPYYTAGRARNWARGGISAIIDPIPPQQGRFRPIPELASGRMPIKGLYATGSAWHPFHGSNPFQGYNVYKVMAQDLGLRKPWDEKGRPY